MFKDSNPKIIETFWMKGYVCITGISTGLGRCIALSLCKNGYHVVGTVRKASDKQELEDLKLENLSVVICDVTRISEVAQLVKVVEDLTNGQGLKALINNAGIVESGPLMYLDENRMSHQMEVNLLGVHRVTKGLFPILKNTKDSRIIMMSSISGFISFPFTGAYAASKFALEGYSDALRREVAIFDIKVTIIEPAAVRTPIWMKSASVTTAFRETPYADVLTNSGHILKKNSEESMDPEHVAEVVLRNLEAKSPKIRHLVAPRPWIYWLIGRVIPNNIVDRLMIRRLFNK